MCYTVRNSLDVGNFARRHFRIDIRCGISQHEADILQRVVQIAVGAVECADILDIIVVFDDVFVAQDFHLAACHLDFHVFIENAAGLVV